MEAQSNEAHELNPAEFLRTESAEARTIADDSQTLADASGAGAEHRPGVVVPDHELLTCIGRGSYGHVWLARNVMGTYRAVKIVYRAAFEHARPFEREFNGIQKFEPISRSHDGFVDVLQIGRAPEYFYYVMELADDVVTGQEIDPSTYQPKTLHSQVQAHKPLPLEQCVELGLSLTAALGHLHGHGLIHRDIKPSNTIFVNGISKLADIGLVAEQSEAKSFVGTEGFIPPEGPGTPQADIYSLGKVLYEMATGKDRHEFPTLPTLLAEAADDTQLVELNTVILKACQNTVQLRYQSCQQMRDDLLLLQSGKSVKRAQALERRLSLLTRIGFVGATVTTVALAGFLYVNSLRLRATHAEAESTRQRYVSDMTLAEKEVREGNLRRAIEALDAHKPKLSGPDLPGFEYYYLRQQCEGDQSVKFPQPCAVFAVAYSPDGKVLATGSSYTEERDFSGELKLFDLDSKKEIHRFALPSPEGIRSLAFSPDGAFLAAGLAGAGVHVWNARTHERVDSFFGKEGQTVTVLFTADSRYLAAAFLEPVFQTPGRIVLRDVRAHQERTIVDVQAPSPGALDFSPDGKWLGYGDLLPDGRPVLRLWDLEAGQESSHVPLPLSGGVLAVHFSSDSKTLVYGTRSGQVGLWDLAEHVTPLGKHKDAVLSVCFARTNGLLATSSADGTIKLWQPGVSKEPQLLRGHTNSVQQIAFSPDGTQLASASIDQTARLWSSTRVERDVLRGHKREIVALDFSPRDGKMLATGSLDRTVRIWDLRGDEPPLVLQGFTNDIVRVEFSPDGHFLAVGAWDCVVFDVITWRPVVKLQPGAWDVIDLRFSRDGKFLITERPTLHIYEVGSWRLAKTLPAAGTTTDARITASEDSQVLAVGSDIGTHLYEIGTWQIRRTLPGATGQQPQALAFARDGHLAIANGDASICIWDLNVSQRPPRLTGQVGRVSALAVSPDSKTLAVADMSGAIRLRNMSTGKELFALEGHETAVNALGFSTNGVLASGGSDGTVRLWRTAASSARVRQQARDTSEHRF